MLLEDEIWESVHVVPFDDPNVARRFASFPQDLRAPLLDLREMIFDIAQKTPGVGAIEETLKWGQPAYLTPVTKSGSTIRLGQAGVTGCARADLSP